MKQLAGIILLFAVLTMPKAASAQQTAQGSSLQSSGAALQQAPAGLQGSVPQIFDSSGGILDQVNQKLSNAPSTPNTSNNAQKAKEVSVAQPAKKPPNIFLAVLCLAAAAAALRLWFWLRQFS